MYSSMCSGNAFCVLELTVPYFFLLYVKGNIIESTQGYCEDWDTVNKLAQDKHYGRFIIIIIIFTDSQSNG